MRALLVGVLVLTAVGSAGPAQQPPPRAGEVTALLPNALIHRGAATTLPARLQAEVLWQDLFETQPRARARIELLDGSILNLGSAAKMLIARHDRQSEQTALELQVGKLRARVQKLSQAGAEFTLRTQTAVVGVIGTHVYADAQPAATTVINLDTGRSRVRSAEPGVSGEELLEPFEVTTVAAGEPPTPKRRATVEEILQAMLDTLPGLSLPLGPGHARAGSCAPAVAADRLVDADGDGLLARLPFLELAPTGCGGSELTPVRLCVPEQAGPGLYEFSLPTAAGERLSALLVRPAEPANRMDGARLVYAPEAPPGSVVYARLLDAQGQPLEGVPVQVKAGDEETQVHTDAGGAFLVRMPESGPVDMRVEVGPAGSGGPTLPSLAGRVQPVADLRAEGLRLPEAAQRGDVINLSGELAEARLGDRTLPVVRTVTRTGETISTVVLPPDAREGPAELTVRDAAGREQRRSLTVFEILLGRLDQPALTSGMETGGEFLACVGDARMKTVRARIVAVGPVHFRGPGAKGKTFEKKLPVGPTGLVRIPFRIRAEKGAPGAGVPFTLRVVLTP